MLTQRTHNFPDGMIGRAIFSQDMRYRYMLSRIWSDKPALVFTLLNPSVGDEMKLEPTTAGCMTRAKNWDYGGIIVFNLFGLIATDPKKLNQSNDPIGELNDLFLDYAASLIVHTDAKMVCAWGKNGTHMYRDREVLDLYRDIPLYALDLNKDGTPRHPLHMAHSTTPKVWAR